MLKIFIEWYFMLQETISGSEDLYEQHDNKW